MFETKNYFYNISILLFVFVLKYYKFVNREVNFLLFRIHVHISIGERNWMITYLFLFSQDVQNQINKMTILCNVLSFKLNDKNYVYLSSRV